MDDDIMNEINEEFAKEFADLSSCQSSAVSAKAIMPVAGSNESSLQSVWQLPKQSIQAALDISKIYRTKHGMFAGVPIICKDNKCPYKEVCVIDTSLRVAGQRCIMEAGAIIARFDAWCRHFSIDTTQEHIKDEDLVDATLIRDLVDNEIQTLRAENRVALNSDFIGKTITQIDNKGKVYYEETVTPEATFKLTLQERRYKILNLLNSTRKDKSSEKKLNQDLSGRAASIFNKVAELMPYDLDDIDFSLPEIQDIEPVTIVDDSKE